jgi:GGDEF domain-containing protein
MKAEGYIKALTLDPHANLAMLTRELIEETGAEACFVPTFGETPPDAEALYKIPIVFNEGRVRDFIYLQDCTDEGKTESEACKILVSLIVNQINAYHTLQAASTDKLTGALNRKYLDMAIDDAFNTAKRRGTTLSVIICDLDFFKHVNDTYGHTVGDEVLRDTSKVIREVIGASRVLGRYGGEEFVVLLDDSYSAPVDDNEGGFAILLENTEMSEAARIAEKLRTAIHNAKILGDKRDITVSLGVATYPDHAGTRKTLVEKADQALYSAKKSGRNRFMSWNESMDDGAFTKNIARELITGDAAKDGARVMSLFDLMDIAARELSFEDKLEIAFNQIIDTLGTDNATLFVFEGDEITVRYRFGRGVFCNEDIARTAAAMKAPAYLVDWDNGLPDGSGMTDWQSVCAAPCVKDTVVKAVLYVTISVKNKEFSDDECGFIANAANLIATF